jgi:hypothetical protein
MTEALLPSAVSANTSGAILLAVAPDIGKRPWPTVPACAEATTGKREEAMVPMAATAAATKNNEQKIRRHRDGVNVGVGFEFLIMEVAGAFVVVAGIGDPGVLVFLVRERTPRPRFYPKAR